MADQMNLDDYHPDDESIQNRFERFHSRNPAVYSGLVKLARRGKAAGRTKLGIGMLYEVLRWEWIITGLPADDEQYKLNDHYRSRYARLIMDKEPDLAGIFEIRGLRAA